MQAIIPVAGYATRLYPLTKGTPKALLGIGGKPILDHILEKITELPDVKEITLVTNDTFYQPFAAWARETNQQQNGLHAAVLNDHTTTNENRLGMIADLQYAFKETGIDDDLVIVNGDNLFRFSLVPAHEKFRETGKPVVGLYGGLSKEEVANKFGVVEVADGVIAGFEEKPAQPKTNLISTGIYFFPKHVISLVNDYLAGGNRPDAPGYFLEWLHSRETVLAHVFTEKWFDIGSFEQLEQARQEFT